MHVLQSVQVFVNGQVRDLCPLLGQRVTHLSEILHLLLLRWLGDELFQVINAQLFNKLDFLIQGNGQYAVIVIIRPKNIPNNRMAHFFIRPAGLFANSAHSVKRKRNYHGIKSKRSDFNFIQYSCKYFSCFIYCTKKKFYLQLFSSLNILSLELIRPLFTNAHNY